MTMQSRDRTASSRVKSSVRNDVSAHANERRAKVYRSDVPHTGTEDVRKGWSKAGRRELAAHVYALKQSGMTTAEVMETCGIKRQQVFALCRDHVRRYEPMRKREEENRSE